MKIVVQRSKHASVEVEGKTVGKIDAGMTILVGFTQGDTEETIRYMVHKLLNLRIFDDEEGVMNKSILQVGGSILSVSQFSLYGDATKGNRPSYIKAMRGSDARLLYDLFNTELAKSISVATGIFGAEMLVKIENDGPITILLER